MAHVAHHGQPLRRTLGSAALAAGVLATAVLFLEPAAAGWAWTGAVLATAGFLGLPPDARPHRRFLFVALAWTVTLGAWARPQFRADAASYFVQLRSVAFDHDLDFRNEWEQWGYPELPPTATGLQPNVQSVGPALAWSPFFLLAHLYVLTARALGLVTWAADGMSPPYLRSAGLGTLTVAVLGAGALASALARRFGWRAASLGVLGAVLASPVGYYVFVENAMSHGIVFGVGCFFVVQWLRVAEAPNGRRWAVLGLLFGLLALARWQALVTGFLLLALAVRHAFEGRLSWRWLAGGAGLALAAFAPQMLVWKALYDRPLTLPQGGGFLDWTSPGLVAVLTSANHGLLNWTPLTLAGLLGLAGLLRVERAFAVGSLLVFLATAWVNGAVRDWWGSDAFGARRFDVVVPLLAVGLAWAARWTASCVTRRPWAVPVALAGIAVAWNLGFIRLHRAGAFPSGAAPIDRLAALQARQARDALERALPGPALRAWAYEAFAGEYFYRNVNPGGLINVGAPDCPWLGDGWSRAKLREGWPHFRWAFHPRACAWFAVTEPFALRVQVQARAPDGIRDQVMSLGLNGVPVGATQLQPEWAVLGFDLPARAVAAGRNTLCLDFSEALPGEAGARVAAAVAVIQLP